MSTEETKFENMVGAGDKSTEIVPAGEESHSGIQLANFSAHAEFDSGDTEIPRVRLAQGLTAEVQDGSARPGQWLFTGFTPQEELTVVPILFARQRRLQDDAGMTLCKSNDAKTGVGDPGGDCSICPMNTWNEGPKGEKIPPPCAFSYVYICYIKEHDSVGLVEFRRTSLSAGKTLNTICAQRGLGNFAVKLKSSKQQGNRGAYFQMMIQPINSEPELLQNARSYLA